MIGVEGEGVFSQLQCWVFDGVTAIKILLVLLLPFPSPSSIPWFLSLFPRPGSLSFSLSALCPSLLLLLFCFFAQAPSEHPRPCAAEPPVRCGLHVLQAFAALAAHLWS